MFRLRNSFSALYVNYVKLHELNELDKGDKMSIIFTMHRAVKVRRKRKIKEKFINFPSIYNTEILCEVV